MDIAKLDMEFTEDDILDASILNTIESKIYEVRNKIYSIGFTGIPSYSNKTWAYTDYLIYSYLNNIEDGIKNIGKYYYRPYGWQDTKTWKAKESFSYKDVNRWINDLNLVIDRLNTESSSLFPSDTLYPSETLLPH